MDVSLAGMNEEVSVLSPVMNRIVRTAVVVIVTCGAVACAMGPRKTEAEQQVDREMADRVQAALNADKVLYARHINVQADNGVVRLGGYVWTQPDLEEAIRVAALVPGVNRVVDNLELERAGIDNSQISR